MILAALSSIICGGLLFSGPKTVLGSEYSQSAQYILKVNNVGASQPSAEQLAKKAADDIKKRLDGDSNLDVKTSAEIDANGDPIVRVTYPNIYDLGERSRIAQYIEYKPRLVFTDYYGNALFNSEGKFNSQDLEVGKDPGKAIKNPEEVDWDVDSKTPIKADSASAIYNNVPIIKTEWNNDSSEAEWTPIKDYIAKLPEEKRIIAGWINLNEYIHIAKTRFADDWKEAKQQPYAFSFVSNKPVDENGKPNNLKTALINASDFLVSNNVRSEDKEGQKGLYLQRPINTSSSDLSKMTRQINYGTANYELKLDSERFLPAQFGNNSFKLFLWVSLVIFSILTLFLVFNYGLVGLISSLSIALFAFLAWTFIVFLGGVFSAMVLTALIFMLAFFVDKNIVFFEKIKTSLRSGSTIEKALLVSRKKMTSHIFDTHIVILILGISLFYFGSLSIWGFSLTIIITLIFSLLVLLLFTKFLVITLLKANIFQNNKRLLIGLNRKTQLSIPRNDFSNEQIAESSYNFTNKSRYVGYGLGATVALALLVMIIFMIVTLSFSGGLNLATLFRGGSIVEVNAFGKAMSPEQVDEIIKILLGHGVKPSDIMQYTNDDGSVYLIRVALNRPLDLSAIQEAINHDVYETHLSNVLNHGGKQLLLGAFISFIAAFTFIMIYVLFRFKWTFAITMLTTICFDIILVVALFIIFRLLFNFEFIIIIFIILIYVMNNQMTLFAQIKARTTIHSGDLNYEQNIKIANFAVAKIIKQLIWRSMIFIALFALVFAFGNITNLSSAMAIVFGLVINLLTTMFISPKLWANLETKRQKGIAKRSKNKFWDVNKFEEQTFNGINNYKI